MLQTGLFINQEYSLIVKKVSIMQYFQLDMLIKNIGLLKILGEQIGENKDSLD